MDSNMESKIFTIATHRMVMVKQKNLLVVNLVPALYNMELTL